jgi:hypothetical protein
MDTWFKTESQDASPERKEQIFAMKKLMTDQYLTRADEYKKKFTLKISNGLDPKGAKASIAAERLRETEERR